VTASGLDQDVLGGLVLSIEVLADRVDQLYEMRLKPVPIPEWLGMLPATLVTGPFCDDDQVVLASGAVRIYSPSK
jgi:hypothetical protein